MVHWYWCSGQFLAGFLLMCEHDLWIYWSLQNNYMFETSSLGSLMGGQVLFMFLAWVKSFVGFFPHGTGLCDESIYSYIEIKYAIQRKPQWSYRVAACDVIGVWFPLILMLQSCKFLKLILEAQVIQLCSMDILRLTIDFRKMYKVWSLCMEFYGAWQEVAMHHRTKDQTLDIFIKSTIKSKTFIVQIWVI